MEVTAIAKYVRLSPRKSRDFARAIQGLSAADALKATDFSERKAAALIGKAIRSAIANAENNHNLDVDQLIVAEAYVGKNLVMKRFHARARGRMGRIEKPFSQLTVVVREVQEQA